MKKIEKKTEMKWNPVNEAVPSDDRYILLSFENWPVVAVGRYEENKEGGAFYLNDDDRTCASVGIFVNAWMELPERYEG